MPSAFKEFTRSVVQEMDSGGDMIPVRSISDADRFHCFWLVRKKRTFLGSRYYKTDLTLADILEGEEGESLSDELDSACQGQKSKFQMEDHVDSKRKLTVKWKGIEIEGSFQVSHKWKTELLKNQISQQYLNTLQNRKLKRGLPPSFQSIRATRADLYLVTETLETTKKQLLTNPKKQYKLQSQIFQGSIDYEHNEQLMILGGRDCGPTSQRWPLPNLGKVTIPPKSVVGYRVKQLVFPNTERMSVYFGDKTKSFPEGRSLESDDSTKPLHLEDPSNIKERVEDMVSGLHDLTEVEQKEVLSSLMQCLSEDGHLEDLQERVFETLVSGELQMEGSSGPLLSSLFNTAGILLKAPAETILDLLDALIELPEEKQFVVEALKKRILPQLKDQVRQPGLRTTVEQIFNNQASNPHDMSWDTEASDLCALYVAVSILLQLSKEHTSVSS
ncbi:gasdermin-B [Otolemur garnettii]|uniref:gasdermin-B n=1 Tax=Otolemur garnettii TaxID=30611 RepID=UPI0006445122|nr:gasdermin-B [Otolemur garnettii]